MCLTSDWLFLRVKLKKSFEWVTLKVMPHRRRDTQYEIRNTNGNFSAIRSSFCLKRGTSFKIILLLVAFFALTGCVSPAMAQTPMPASNTQNVLNSLLNSFAGCMIAGVSLIPGEKCSLATVADASMLDQKSGLGFVGKAISTSYTPPLSSSAYLADLGQSLGFAKPAYAQAVTGSGEGVIAPVKKLWQITRNFTYLMFTLVFVGVGVMIMLRRKLNPQTVLNIQSALPGLVVGLILVTFSYLIAALIIDLSFLLIPIVAGVFEQAGGNIFKEDGKTLQDFALNSNVFSFFKPVFWNHPTWPLDIAIFSGTPPGSINKEAFSVANLFPWLIRGVIDLTLGLGNLLIMVIIVIALFFQMIRLLWLILKSYISILVFTVLGPLLILMSSVPGQGKSLEFWWRNLLGNALIFPAIFATFFFGGLILSETGIDQNAFNQTLPLFAGMPVYLLKYIIGFAIILGTPAVPQMVKEAIGVKDLKGIPEAAMAGFAAGTVPMGRGIKQGLKPYESERQAYKEAKMRSMFPSDKESFDSMMASKSTRPKWYTRMFNS